MRQRLVCPQGHRWDDSLASVGGAVAAPIACPVCGQPCVVQPPTLSGAVTAADDPFRSLSRSIIYQQLSGKAAGTIYSRFVALFEGSPVDPAMRRTDPDWSEPPEPFPPRPAGSPGFWRRAGRRLSPRARHCIGSEDPTMCRCPTRRSEPRSTSCARSISASRSIWKASTG